MELDLDEARDELDSLNEKIADLVERRMDLVVDVARYKDENDMQIVDEEREAEVKQEFENLFEERGLPKQSGRELAEYLIQTAIDREEEILDREVER
jgi:chorismate mutase